MLHEWLGLPPGGLIDGPPALALAVTAAGAFFWLVGGRFSRSVVTLALVAAGAWVGVRLPRWCGWEIDGMGVAMAAALLLGVAGYLLHRTWIGVLLGTLAAVGAGAAVWVGVAPGVQWTPPVLEWSWNFPDVLRQVWQSLPAEVSKVLPLVTIGAFVAGVVMALLWPKLSRILAFDLLGVLLLVTVGLPVVARYQPQWLAHLPSGTERRVFAVIGMVLAGLAVQWKLTPSTPRKAAIPASALRPAAPPVSARVVGPTGAIAPKPVLTLTPAGSAAPRGVPRPAARRFVQLQEVLA